MDKRPVRRYNMMYKRSVSMKKLEWKLQLPYSACDFTGCWRPSAILETMQEIAGSHSLLLNCGRDDMMKKNIVWVITRIEVKMNRYPVAEEEIIITTFPKEVRRWFFPRYFTFSTPQGEILGHASTIWVLLDINTRKMVPPTDIIALMPDNSDIQAPMGLPSPTKLLSDDNIKMVDYQPLYSDIDVNFHVNNTKYIEWFCNMVGIDTLKNQVMESFCLNYDAEIRPDESITLELRTQENERSLTGFKEDTKHFEISSVLRNRMDNEKRE